MLPPHDVVLAAGSVDWADVRNVLDRSVLDREALSITPDRPPPGGAPFMLGMNRDGQAIPDMKRVVLRGAPRPLAAGPRPAGRKMATQSTAVADPDGPNAGRRAPAWTPRSAASERGDD